MDEYCKCGKEWNINCDLKSRGIINTYVSNCSIEDLMSRVHPSGFFYMTAEQRRAFVTSPANLVPEERFHDKVIYKMREPPSPVPTRPDIK